MLVVQILALIQAGYADRVTLDVLARKMGVEPQRLSRLFRRRTGTTVHQYLTETRLERAVEQIREGVKIEAVALGVGYRSKKNFYRQFKQRFGVTPDQYRQRSTSSGHPGLALASKSLVDPFRIAPGLSRSASVAKLS